MSGCAFADFGFAAHEAADNELPSFDENFCGFDAWKWCCTDFVEGCDGVSSASVLSDWDVNSVDEFADEFVWRDHFTFDCFAERSWFSVVCIVNSPDDEG